MINFKYIYIPFIIFILCIKNSYSDIIIAKSFNNDSGKTWTWKISDETYKNLPEINWETRLELNLKNAVEKAHKLVVGKNPGKEIVIERIAIVQPIIVETRQNKYFYDMSFSVFSKNKAHFIRTEQVVMFLNGKVIDPDEK